MTRNTIALTGEYPNIKKFKQAIKGANGVFDLSKISVMPEWYEEHPEWNARNIKTRVEDEYIYIFETIWDAPRHLVKPIIKLAHDLGIYVEWEATHKGRYEEYEVIFTEYSVGKTFENKCRICEMVFCKKGIDVPGGLQTFDGYTVDFRLKQFRKVEPDGFIEFVDFDSEKGQQIETRMHRASMEELTAHDAA